MGAARVRALTSPQRGGDVRLLRGTAVAVLPDGQLQVELDGASVPVPADRRWPAADSLGPVELLAAAGRLVLVGCPAARRSPGPAAPSTADPSTGGP